MIEEKDLNLERAVLIGVITKDQNEEKSKEYLDELEFLTFTAGIGTAIFDDELSSAQERNISKILECKVLDRTNLILDIFAQRAQTSYARTQVELAQCEYLLPERYK